MGSSPEVGLSEQPMRILGFGQSSLTLLSMTSFSVLLTQGSRPQVAGGKPQLRGSWERALLCDSVLSQALEDGARYSPEAGAVSWPHLPQALCSQGLSQAGFSPPLPSLLSGFYTPSWETRTVKDWQSLHIGKHPSQERRKQQVPSW